MKHSCLSRTLLTICASIFFWSDFVSAQISVTDILTGSMFTATGNKYESFTGVTASSDAVYAGKTANNYSSIQLRSDGKDCGIVTTASGGKVRKITVVWNSSTVVGRTLNVYGKSTAYAAASDLYSDDKQGTILGTIVYKTSTILEVDGDYEYIGLCSESDAMYINKITIEWETTTESSVTAPVFSPEGGEYTSEQTVTLTADDGCTIFYTTDGSMPATESIRYTDPITISETTTIKAIAVDTNGESSNVATAKYTLVEKASETITKAVYTKVTSTDEITENDTYIIVSESGKKAMGAISNSHGTGIDADTNAKVHLASTTSDADMKFEMQQDSSYAIKHSAGYIGYGKNSTNFAAQSETLPDDKKFLWTISFSEAGDASIQNVGSNRYIMYNNDKSYDFRPYEDYSGNVVQLYRKIITVSASSESIALAAKGDNGAYYSTFSDSEHDVVFADDVTVYTVSVSGSKMSQDEIGKATYIEEGAITSNSTTAEGYYVPKNTGVLICSADTTRASYRLPAQELDGAAADMGNMLRAAGMPMDDTDYKYYKLAYDDYSAKTGLGFYWGADNGGAFTVKDGLAYLAIPQTSEAAPARFVFTADDDVTGIKDTDATANTQQPVIYSITGQRVENVGRRGIYIVNGRKVVME